MSFIENPIYKHFCSIGSTHVEARKRKTETVVISADEQTNGIGKRLRKWFSPVGNVYFSVALPFENRANSLSFLSLLTGCAVYNFLEKFVCENENLKLHWPNDVFYKGKKVCGILLEVPQDSRLIISVGINNATIPSGVSETAEKINLGMDKNSEDFAREIVEFLNNWYDVFINDRSQIISYWNERMIGKGKYVKVTVGDKEIYGILEGIDQDGNLLLCCNGSIKHISSGEVFL